MKILDKKGTDVGDTIDLGIVSVGESKIFEFFLHNNSEFRNIDIKVSVENDEVDILSVPEKLNADEKSVFKIKWTPSLEVKKGLKTTVKITAMELWE